MHIRQIILSMSLVASLGTGCIVEVASRSAYEGCSGGQSCGGGTLCTSATFTSNGLQGNLCTLACNGPAQCPSLGTNSAFAPTCVINTAGVGQCYDTCGSNLDCGIGTQCATVPGTTAQVCVPVGSGTPVTPVLPPPYTGCTPAGATCANSTTCLPSSFMRTGAAQGNLCTISCTSGNAAMCPGYVAGAARQVVECVAPAGNVAAAQCMRLCTIGTNDCPTGTTCSAVQMAAGTLTVCVP